MGVIGLGLSMIGNMNYGIGLGIARSGVDALGFYVAASLIATFAASGGLAAVGIGLGVGIATEVTKWGVTEISNKVF